MLLDVAFDISMLRLNVSRFLVLRVLQGLFILVLLIVLWLGQHEWIALRDEIEQANHKAEVNNIRTDMTEAWVHRQLEHKNVDAKKLVNTNPVRLMQTPPLHYLGELKQWPKQGAVWFYDERRHCLVYVYQNGKSEGYRLKAEIGMLSGLNIVRDKTCKNNK